MKKLLPILCFNLLSAFILSQTMDTATYAGTILQHREAYKKDFLHNERSPLKSKEDLANLRFFEPDERFRFVCSFERTPDEKPFDLPTYSGITKPFVKYGILTFEMEGRQYKLSVYQNLLIRGLPQYAEHLFLPFRDLTNDDLTYGGGRYIDLKMTDMESDAPVLDFNKCYNPWCAYSDGYNCPIPPVENNLEIAIEAGEKIWMGEKKK
jgi:hypothetical protein